MRTCYDVLPCIGRVDEYLGVIRILDPFARHAKSKQPKPTHSLLCFGKGFSARLHPMSRASQKSQAPTLNPKP